MYFIPRNNKLYAWAAFVRPSYRYIVTCCFVVLTSASWWYGLHLPVEQMLTCYRQESSAMHKQCAVSREQCRLDMSMEQSVQELRTRLQVYGVEADGIVTEGDPLETVLHSARDQGLTLCSYNSEKEQQKDWYTMTHATFGFTGSYQQLIDAIDALHKDQLLVRVKQISLSRIAQENFKISCLFSFFTMQ